jgi:putative transcriptional regulator
MLDIKELRAWTGLSQAKFADFYGIPKRTIENWEGGKTKAPDYVLMLLERAVKEDFKI